MIKLFYQDKIIIFSSLEDSFIFETAIFNDYPSLEEIISILEQQEKGIVIKSSSSEMAFSNFRKYFKEVIACGGLVKNSRGESLMIYRNQRWDIPKGKIEIGESLSECAVREVIEETGIESIETIGEPIKTFHFYNIYGCWELKTTYWYRMIYNGNLELSFTPQKEEGITECRWIKEEEIKELTRDSYATIKHIIFNL